MSTKSQIESTEDYTIFKEITSNREVDEKHVRKLMSSIRTKNLLELNPIIVNNSMQVIDGQHRLEAAKRLKETIYYVVSDKLSKSDIAELNANQKKWSLNDYINYFTIEGVESFQILSKFINTHSWIKPTTALKLVSSSGKYDRASFYSGKIDVDNVYQAHQVATLCTKIRNLYVGYDFVYTSMFIMAIRQCFSTPEFNEDVLIEQIQRQPRTLVQCVNTDQYLELLQELYNYRKHHKNTISWI